MTKPTHVLFIGATGSIGRLAVAEGLAQGYQVRALVRDTSRAHFDARVDMFEGDLTSVESLKGALDGINGIVFTMGAHDGPSMIEKIDYGAVRNTLLALDGRKVRIALMTAIGVTYMDSKYNRDYQAHDWKRRSERLVRTSGNEYTIVRPAGSTTTIPTSNDSYSCRVTRIVTQVPKTAQSHAHRLRAYWCRRWAATKPTTKRWSLSPSKARHKPTCLPCSKAWSRMRPARSTACMTRQTSRSPPSPNACSGISTRSSHWPDHKSPMTLGRRKTMNARKALSTYLCITALALGGCGSIPDTKPESSRQTATNSSKGSSMVVVYFSRAGENYGVGNVKVGNTAKLAEAIAEETDAPLIEITRNEPYPEGYDEATSVAQDEQRDNARPQITLNGDTDALDSADTVFLGYPIWWGDVPMPVYTFLEGRDWKGKTIYPFCTHEGSGLASTSGSIADATGATVKTGLAVRGTDAQKNADKTAKAVSDWIAKAGL